MLKRISTLVISCCTLGLVLLLGALVYISYDGFKDRVFPADVALVLGNRVYSNGECSPRLKGRLDRAADLYTAGMCTVIIASGGVDNGMDEAEAMKLYLMDKGIPHEAVVADPSGKNTRASAIFTARYMRENNLQSVLVVSQYFHITRTKLALRDEGLSTIGSAHARYFEGRDAYSILREVVGLAAYYVGYK